MLTVMRRLGDSRGITIPKPMLKEAGLELDNILLVKRLGNISQAVLASTLKILQRVFA
jgi:antitoxin component of MazEF toxin-antitoxin module